MSYTAQVHTTTGIFHKTVEELNSHEEMVILLANSATNRTLIGADQDATLVWSTGPVTLFAGKCTGAKFTRGFLECSIYNTAYEQLQRAAPYTATFDEAVHTASDILTALGAHVGIATSWDPIADPAIGVVIDIANPMDVFIGLAEMTGNDFWVTHGPLTLHIGTRGSAKGAVSIMDGSTRIIDRSQQRDRVVIRGWDAEGTELIADTAAGGTRYARYVHKEPVDQATLNALAAKKLAELNKDDGPSPLIVSLATGNTTPLYPGDTVTITQADLGLPAGDYRIYKIERYLDRVVFYPEVWDATADRAIWDTRKYEELGIYVSVAPATQATSVAAAHDTPAAVSSPHSTSATVQSAHSTTTTIASAHSIVTVVASNHSTTTTIATAHGTIAVVATDHNTTTTIATAHGTVTVIASAHGTSVSIQSTHTQTTVLASKLLDWVYVNDYTGTIYTSAPNTSNQITVCTLPANVEVAVCCKIGLDPGSPDTTAGCYYHFLFFRSGTAYFQVGAPMFNWTTKASGVYPWRSTMSDYTGATNNKIELFLMNKKTSGSLTLQYWVRVQRRGAHTHGFTNQPSGHPVGVQPADHGVDTQPSGHPVSVQPSGHPVSTQPSGHPVSQQPSGHTVSTQPSGHSVSQQPSGHPVSTQPSGHTVGTQPSGHPVTNPSHKHVSW